MCSSDLRHAPDKSLPPAFTVDEIYQALQNMKAGTAPVYGHVHLEFLKNLGPRATGSKLNSKLAVTLFLQDHYCKCNPKNLEKDEGN